MKRYCIACGREFEVKPETRDFYCPECRTKGNAGSVTKEKRNVYDVYELRTKLVRGYVTVRGVRDAVKILVSRSLIVDDTVAESLIRAVKHLVSEFAEEYENSNDNA